MTDIPVRVQEKLLARKYSSHINEIKPIWQSISFDLRIADARIRSISEYPNAVGDNVRVHDLTAADDTDS